MTIKVIQSNDVKFRHNGNALVFAIRNQDDVYIDAMVGIQIDDNQFDTKFTIGADTSYITDAGKTMLDFVKEDVLPLVNEKIVEHFGAFQDGAEELWQKIAKFCADNVSYDPEKGLIVG